MIDFGCNLGFQDPVTPIMEGIVDLHGHIFCFLVWIFMFVASVFLFIIIEFGFAHKFYKRSFSILQLRRAQIRLNTFTHNSTLELIWTLTPTIILILIAIPSFSLLYSLDEVLGPILTIKVIGHQWYWVYELSPAAKKVILGKEIKSPTIESNMRYLDQINFGEHRLLQVDHVLTIPAHVYIRFLVTSSDVLHSWAVPALGVKIDAVPGRLNQIYVHASRTGQFYGQCSELCGVNHGFMPIALTITETPQLIKWR